MIIQHLQESSEPLNAHHYATHHSAIYAAAERLFGSWKAAIEAAGFDYNEIRKYRRWSDELVIAEIRRAKENGEQISSKYVQEHNKPLYMAAIKRFKSWNNALRKAKINPRKVRLRRSMTAAEVKKEILRLYKKKVDLSYSNMRKNYQYLLAAGMKKLGNGSWAEARRVCGIEDNFRLPKQKRQQSRKMA